MAVAVAACATIPQHQIPIQEVTSWKLVAIEGEFAPDATMISWPRVNDDFQAKEKERLPAGVVEDSGFKRRRLAYAQAELTERLRHTMEPVRASLTTGQRPVKIAVVVEKLVVPSLAQSILLGAAMALVVGPVAAQQKSEMVARATVTDARTGAVLLAYPQRFVQLPSGDKLLSIGDDDRYAKDAVGLMLRTYAKDFGKWLLKQT